MARRWYHQADGERRGPFTDRELAGLFRSGALTPESLVSAENEDAWAPARVRVPDLAEAPPPVVEVDLAPPRSGWTDTAPHPWRRYFARFLDNLFIGGALWLALTLVAYMVDPWTADRFFHLLAHPAAGPVEAVLTVALVMPVQVLMIGATGLSPGKWVFGVRVLRDGAPIGLPAALLRELGVWTRGQGLGVPILSLVTLATSYAHLMEKGAAPWDKARGVVVVHRRGGALQVLLMLVAVPALLGAAVALKLAGAR